mmetsp:Transcript_3086/g.7386  ORF Transcript_3086/g.7386 Transcript_3086/m.7386 type:complete len:241 (+) Transcript_3086:170-892(+)
MAALRALSRGVVVRGGAGAVLPGEALGGRAAGAAVLRRLPAARQLATCGPTSHHVGVPRGARGWGVGALVQRPLLGRHALAVNPVGGLGHPVRFNTGTSTPLGVSAEEAAAEVDREFLPGYGEMIEEDAADVEAIQRVFDLQNASNADVLRFEIQQVMKEYQQFDGDTGSVPVQVAILTTRLKNMQRHLSEHRKDKHSRRGMQAMLEKRRKLLQYIKRKDFEGYNDLIRRLALRPVAGLR